MGLSPYLEKVIENNYYKLLARVPMNELFSDLKSKQILTDDQVNDLKYYIRRKDRIDTFIKAMKTRDDEDFYQFCQILQQHQAATVRNLGKALREEAKSIYDIQCGRAPQAEYSTQDLLHNVPQLPENRYIIREDFIDTICSYLEDLNSSNGHVLIYGISGCGKTTSVAQSVKLMIEEQDCFKPHGVYWVKIGDIQEDELLYILINLCHQLDIQWDRQPQSLKEMDAYLRRYFRGHKSQSEIIFVFDDVRNGIFFDYLAFANKSIVITPLLYPQTRENYDHIKAPEQFTYQEAIQVLALYQNKRYTKKLRQNELVKQILENIRYLPLAVVILAGLRLKTDQEWQEVLAKTEVQDSSFKLKFVEYRFNLFEIITICINKLDIKKRDLFRQLGVFKRVKIPIHSIMCLWQCNQNEAVGLLEELDSRCLLKYHCNKNNERNYCILHEKIIDYLQQPIDSQQSQQSYVKKLHQTLIDSYVKLYDGKWSTYPDDGYFYQYIIYHAIQADDDSILATLMTDFNWMMNKLKKFKSLSNLRLDLIDYINYLKLKNKNPDSFEELLDLLQQHEFYLDKESMNLIQFLLYCAKKDSWIVSKATQIANKKVNMGKYWTITKYPQNKTDDSPWIESKTIDTNSGLILPKCSRPRNGDIKIIYANNNRWRKDCTIVVSDYETSKIKVKFSLPKTYVFEVRISSDANIIAYLMSRDRREEWEIHNIGTRQRLQAIKQDGSKIPVLDWKKLEFCPIIPGYPVAMTVSRDRKDIAIWKIQGREMKHTGKSISYLHQIERCEFVQNSSKILIWWRKYNSYRLRLQDDNSWINECQIEVWDIQDWNHYQSFEVPGFIQYDHGQFTAGKSTLSCLELATVKYIDLECTSIIASYGDTLLQLFSNGNEDKRISNSNRDLTNSLKVIYQSEKYIADIVISDDHLLIAVRMHLEPNIMIFKMEKNAINSYSTIHCVQDAKTDLVDGNLHLIFIPGSHDLLVYNQYPMYCLYRYNLEATNLDWQSAEEAILSDRQTSIDKCNSVIIDSSHAFVHDIPIIAKLVVNKQDGSCRLKVYQGEGLEQIADYKLAQPYQRCFLYDDCDFLILVTMHTCHKKQCVNGHLESHHWHIIITQLYHSRGNLQQKQQINHTLRDDPERLILKESKHRISDNTLIFVFYAEYEDESRPWIVMMVNHVSGDSMIYFDDDYPLYEDMKIVFCNNYNLVTYQKIRNSQELAIEWYKLGDGINIKHFKTYSYHIQDQLACKIVVPISKRADDLEIGLLPWNRLRQIMAGARYDSMSLERPFKREIKVTQSARANECFVIEKGNVMSMFYLDDELLVKSYKDARRRQLDIEIADVDNLWTDKYLVEKRNDHIYFYDKTTLQLMHVLQSPHIKCKRIKGNRQQSLFICQDDERQYSIIKRIEGNK
ncbi:uncharacterized protein TRIADDRAFT_60338 [Trichoplax adhaerens]|uniref:CARD domain-containing protein n=1 Tax=Trichoplax adhaerens TaxID=10228 RepID=B3S7Y3_TRIAD|nr:predicted protein [Trichoplax adhaerens]EDV21016.1 predicted protein [Trichoplax adhaerens]|eukprot:XP_002116346.1 predicted protein [Trichoplax adhaerens]